jgi:hypothetical protein
MFSTSPISIQLGTRANVFYISSMRANVLDISSMMILDESLSYTAKYVHQFLKAVLEGILSLTLDPTLNTEPGP